MSAHGLSEERALQQLDGLQRDMGDLTARGPSPSASVSNVAEALALVRNLRQQVHAVLGIELEKELGREVPTESSPSKPKQLAPGGRGAPVPGAPKITAQQAVQLARARQLCPDYEDRVWFNRRLPSMRGCW